MSEWFLLPIRFYRWLFAGKPAVCRYQPTCSQYAMDAIREWGPLLGYGLAFWRILRCHPFAHPRVDEIPRRRPST